MADDGYEPEIILAIARGAADRRRDGYGASVKNLYTMNVEYYTGVDERLEVPMILPPTPELVDVEQAKVLIADDVADTGHTLALVKEFCTGRWPRSGVPCSTRSPGPSCNASTSGGARSGGSTSRGATRTPSPCRTGWLPSRTPEDHPRQQAARTPDAGTGKRGRARQVEPVNRRLVARASREARSVGDRTSREARGVAPGHEELALVALGRHPVAVDGLDEARLHQPSVDLQPPLACE